MTSYNPHHRRSIRLQGYDYRQPGAYFVTLVAHGRKLMFGDIRNDEIWLTDFGFLVENEWRRLEQRFDHVFIDEFVVMPNHLHGILFLTDPHTVGAGQKEVDTAEKPSHAPPQQTPPQQGHTETNTARVGAGQKKTDTAGGSSLAPPQQSPPQQTLPPQPHPESLGAIIRAYKSTTSRLINGLRGTTGIPVWQRNYYEHIIRDESELGHFRQYILDNPNHWAEDRESPRS